MPLIALLFFYLLAVNPFTAKAQEVYKTGFSRVSIEPQHYPFSLALAGYGAPREGRFSLEWIKKGTAEDVIALTGIGGSLLKLDNNVLSAATTDGPFVWKRVGSATDMKLIAGEGKRLYGVNTAGEVLVTNYPGKPAWKKIGEAKDAIAITVLNNVLYMANSEGDVLAASYAGGLNWRQVTSMNGITGLASYKDCLYTLLAQNELWKFSITKDTGWLKIARYNGIGYNVKLNQVAIAGNRLFGCDTANNVLVAQHQTEGLMAVSAMAVSSGKQTVVMAGVDVCGFDYDVISTIKKEVAAKYHLPASAVLINASHTHYSPLGQRYVTWNPHGQLPDNDYLFGTMKPAIVKAIGEALQNRAPSTLSFGRGKTAIGRNRSLTTAPIPYDDDVDVVMAVRKDNQQKTVLFLAGCHPVFNTEPTGNVTISANYPAISRQTLEGKGISHALFLQGCAGDINPKEGSHIKTGQALAADVLNVLEGQLQPVTGAISFHFDSIHFPVTPMPHAEVVAFKTANAPHVGDVEAEKNVRWANLMLKQEQEGTMPATMPVYVQTINIGNWKLVGLSREVVTDYSIGIKKLWPGKLVSVAGYCNDIASYLPTSRHIKAGGYEGHGSFLWYAQPCVFPENVYETILNKIKLNNY